MKYIDVHAHIFPPAVAAKVVDQLEHYYGFHWEGSGVIEDLLDSMDRNGIGRTVIFSSATKPAQVETINRYIAGICAAQPDRFIGFGTMHREYRDYRAEIGRMRELGLKGLKFHPDFQDFDIDDPAMMKIYEAAGPEMVLLFHVGDPKCEHSAPERLARVLDALPGLRIIAAHMGGYSVWERARASLIGRDVWLDTSSCLPHLDVGEMARLAREHGLDKVLFASDYPAVHHARAIADVLALGLSQEEQEMVFHRNAEALLGL